MGAVLRILRSILLSHVFDSILIWNKWESLSRRISAHFLRNQRSSEVPLRKGYSRPSRVEVPRFAHIELSVLYTRE